MNSKEQNNTLTIKRMKNLIFSLFLITTLQSFSQMPTPIKWSTSVKKISATEYLLISKATIEEEWHLYSQKVPENGPIATTFTYDESLNLIGNTQEEKGHIVDDPVFGMKIKFFEKETTFTQKIKLTAKTSKVKAKVRFMVCNDSQCLPPTSVNLEFTIN